jgi:hypothetical protein
MFPRVSILLLPWVSPKEHGLQTRKRSVFLQDRSIDPECLGAEMDQVCGGIGLICDQLYIIGLSSLEGSPYFRAP